jgi:hypothetical protein
MVMMKEKITAGKVKIRVSSKLGIFSTDINRLLQNNLAGKIGLADTVCEIRRIWIRPNNT